MGIVGRQDWIANGDHKSDNHNQFIYSTGAFRKFLISVQEPQQHHSNSDMLKVLPLSERNVRNQFQRNEDLMTRRLKKVIRDKKLSYITKKPIRHPPLTAPPYIKSTLLLYYYIQYLYTRNPFSKNLKIHKHKK